MNLSRKILLVLSAALSSLCASAQICASLPATDELGRKLPTSEEAGPVREGKFVGLFYWTWQTAFARTTPVAFNVGEFVKQHPEAVADYENPAWNNTLLPTYWWGEPLLGYYRNTDPWVLRKHAEMLCEAGVDVIIFDSTNGTLTWDESFVPLCENFLKFREDGVKTPQVAFMLPFAANDYTTESLKHLYEEYYSKGKYKDLWFYWKGKPLIMAHDGKIRKAPEGSLEREISEFFTFRPNQPVYRGGKAERNWGWLEIYPQQAYYPNEDGSFEQCTVGVAQNWTAENGLSAMNMPGAFGRSYSAAKGHSTDPDAVNWGLNFQEQWDRAMEIDPEFVFITGWNEWNMGRYKVWQGQPNAFPDEFNQENSRDIEPMKGGHGDNYYWQMVANIRRFKGVPAEGPAYGETPGAAREWRDASSPSWERAGVFKAYRGNAFARNHPGWGKDTLVCNKVCNDIVGARTMHDASNVYFQVSTADPVSYLSMKLFLDIDRDHATGWEGYDLCVLFGRKGAFVLASDGKDWGWHFNSKADYSISGNNMSVKLPRSVLGVGRDSFQLEFKWTDMTPQDGDVLDFWVYGDTAPLGRFNFLYKADE